ncbi:hypothetical protein XBFM1_520066 [Xenorhabdus bovienii str. feltiae Moldova]|uniref:Uncharacterized protein n=1 Tax=Xenorhabdus bovienii str. feltiae Moldova TaxID=1398200 RepID=A0A077NWZ2_XENBV|nr:hypothetical protein XBFM1_520066 [Xenorhabdus bovienii str. feltiae Moldova]
MSSLVCPANTLTRQTRESENPLLARENIFTAYPIKELGIKLFTLFTS